MGKGFKGLGSLLKSELVSVIKPALLFIGIVALVFTLSISFLSLSADVIEGYSEFLDRNWQADFTFNVDVQDNRIENFIRADRHVTYSRILLNIVAFGLDHTSMQSSYETTAQLVGWGRADIFRETPPVTWAGTPIELEAGEWLGAAANYERQGNFAIYISEQVANVLNFDVGKTLRLLFYDRLFTDSNTASASLSQNQYLQDPPSLEFTIYGIIRDYGASCFIIPVNALVYMEDSLRQNSPTFWNNKTHVMHIDMPSDIIRVLPWLRLRGVEPNIHFLSDIILARAMRFIFITVSILAFTIACFILGNIASIVLQLRRDFIAKLKLLGARSHYIALLYYAFLSFAFLISFVLAILLSFVLRGYYQSIVDSVLAFIDYTVTITTRGWALGILFGTGALILSIRYYFFERKIRRIEPIEAVKNL